MLNKHSRLHVPRESWFLIDLMDALPPDKPLSPEQIEDAFNTIRTHERWSDWELSHEKLRERLSCLTSPTLAQVVDAVFRLSGEHVGRVRWGDKTPGYVREIDRLARLFPRAKFIHLIRDARDVCLSLSKVWWHGQTFRDWARYWSESVEVGTASGRRLGRDRYMEVNYEGLVRHPGDELERICRFLGVPFESGMLTFHQDAQKNIAPWEGQLHWKTAQPPDPENTQKWRRELFCLQVLSVEAVAGETMAKLGQARRFSGPARLACLGWRGVIWLGEWSLPVRRKLGIRFPWLRGAI